MQCSLPYIPERLHSIGKRIVNQFFIGEELYYRCNSEQCKKPYQNISLYDISHNRNFNDKENYPKEDVLFDIDENTENEKIDNKEINISIIKSLSENNTFEKRIISDQNPDLVVDIKLIHSPVPCMYPHCAFQIYLNGTLVTRENYNKLLGRNPREYKNLRRDIRLELTSIIYSSELDNESETEIIEEL